MITGERVPLMPISLVICERLNLTGDLMAFNVWNILEVIECDLWDISQYGTVWTERVNPYYTQARQIKVEVYARPPVTPFALWQPIEKPEAESESKPESSVWDM